MKKTTLFACLLLSYSMFTQVLNQSANWPNTNWQITGSYDADPDLFTDNPTTDSSNFSFNDDEGGGNSINSIAAESDIINLTSAFNAGQTWISVSSNYVYNIYTNETLNIQYWDANSNSWENFGSTLSETNNAPGEDFCNGTPEALYNIMIDISSFTANQLTNFKYRISYNDNNSYGWGFCFDSPTIASEAPPACPNLTGLNVAAGPTFAKVYWQAGSDETSWEIVLQSPGSGMPSGSGTATTNYNPHIINGLTSTTSYEVYVRGYCGGADYSNWIGPITFTTPIPARVNFSAQNKGIGGYDLTVVDMNGDHLDDIVSATSSNVNIHYQLSTGGFNEVNIATPNADFLPGWSMAAADFDRNGYTDLLYAAGNGVTFMKANSSGTGFTEISGSEYVFSQRSNFVDINNDGHLDAFVCHDVAPNVYYINDGSGSLTFYQGAQYGNGCDNPATQVDQVGASGGLGNYCSGGNYGSIWIDYDNDRDLDMFIAKCGGETARRRNQMLTNNGDGSFTENAADLGLDDPMQTWSSSWGDYDNDGDMDLFVGASSGSHKLMRNNNNGTFTNVTSGAGVSGALNGHENVSHDIDNDGYLDILCNGTILYGKGDLTFEDADNSQIDYKNGSFGDLNNDGFIDAYYNGSVYWNLGTNNNWITINTIGTVSNIDGIGARVEIYTNNGVQIRDVRSGEGFEFMSTLNTHFGIGTETSINSVIVYWPSGIVDTVVNPAINMPLEIIEGDTLSLESTLDNDLVLYPNPTKTILNISSTISLQNAVYTIFDISGKRVLNAKLDSNIIDVNALSTGHYILRVISGNTIKTQKFIKQ